LCSSFTQLCSGVLAALQHSPLMEPNTLKWPSFEQLGKDFCEQLKPTIECLASGKDELDDEARQGLSRLESWLSAPCVATVKLDGTNVGVDDAGLVVGRNTTITPGETYQKVDVWSLLDGYSEKAARMRMELGRAAGKEAVGRTMLYGELVVNGKYNYAAAGIFKQWLCFGVAVHPGADDDDAASRLATALKVAGFNARNADGTVTVAPNSKLAAFLGDIQVCTVSDLYTPAGTMSEAQWAEHDGEGRLPCFNSLRQLLLSQWAQRFLLPPDGVPLGEGLVVASDADGRLFKWKHAGEELGKVPDQLAEGVEVLRSLVASPQADLLPQGLLDIFERLLLVATTKPVAIAAAVKKPKNGPQVDNEGIAVWESALTKFDCLESVFENGQEAQKLMQAQLIDQVAKDLVKDYGASEKDARLRAKRIVMTEMGKRFGIWKKSFSNTSES